MSDLLMIPLFTQGYRKCGEISARTALASQGRMTVRKNRRGYPVEAVLLERVELVPLSNRGKAFEQRIATGTVWALRGTPGAA